MVAVEKGGSQRTCPMRASLQGLRVQTKITDLLEVLNKSVTAIFCRSDCSTRAKCASDGAIIP
jgi:hypothetical protein